MSNWKLSIVGLAACLAMSPGAMAQGDGTEDIPDAVVRKVDPSVVMIQHERAVGSGFVISEDGYIMTNGHVVRGSDREDPTKAADSVTVVMNDERKYPAKVIGLFMNPDVALIKIEPDEPLRPVEIGYSRSAQIGHKVFAVGTPSGLKRTFTKGILSNVDRTDIGTFTKVFQTDAAINPGNSGGPLFDSQGRVLGLNTYASIGRNNLGFTIPIHFAMVIKDHFLEHGRFIRADLPIFFVSEIYDEMAAALGVERGILVAYVMENTPAWEAGLRTGDIITELDEHPVYARTEAELLDFNWEFTIRRPGEEVTFTVLRGPVGERQKQTIRATLEEAEPVINTRRFPGEVKTRFLNALGLSYRQITRMHRVAYGLENEPGVLMLTPEKGSAGRQADITNGDVVSHVNGVPTGDPLQLEGELLKALRQHEPVIELTLRRRKLSIPTALAPYYDLVGKTVTVVLPSGTPEYRDLILRELTAAGADLQLASTSGKVDVSDLWSPLPQVPLAALNGNETDMLVLVDGENARELWDNPELARVIEEAFTADHILAGLGSASLSLLSGPEGIKEKKLTTLPELAEEADRRGGRFTGKSVEKDGKILTSTGEDTDTVRDFLKSLRRYR